MKHICVILTLKYKSKGHLSIAAIQTSCHKSKEAALGYAYNETNMSYVQDIDKSTCFLATFQWGWVPTQLKFCIISQKNNSDIYFNFNDQHFRRKYATICDDLILINQERRFGQIDSYPDKSIKMSRWAWQTTIPKGWELLPMGETIVDTDREWEDGAQRKYWLDSPNWYNVGKVVGESPGLSWVKDGVTYDSEPSHPSPIIIRKVK
jgi:hypothetical protein